LLITSTFTWVQIQSNLGTTGYFFKKLCCNVKHLSREIMCWNRWSRQLFRKEILSMTSIAIAI
jgi:hypothetical protein